MRLRDIFRTKSIQAVMISATFLMPHQTSINPTVAAPTYASNITSSVPAETISTTEIAEVPAISETYVKTTSYTAAPIVLASHVSNSISVAGRTIPTFYTNSTQIDAGNQVARYGTHFLFGHNTNHVFGGLTTLNIGSTFVITENGIATTYRVDYTETMEKPTLKNFMGAIVDGRFRGNRYDVILMTCAGTSLGNGDATHRLMIFANAIN